MEQSSTIKKEILRLYNKAPSGWHIFTGSDGRGHIDTVVVRGSDVWLLKEERINPYESVGFGIREERGKMFEGLPGPPFGFRPIPEGLVSMFIKVLGEGKDVGLMIRSLLRQKPTSLEGISTPVALEGPIHHLNKPLSMLSERQAEIDLMLRSELDKLVSKKYPHLRTIYG